MGTPSIIDRLPPIAREQIDRAIREANFSSYVELAQRVKGFGRGISKSSVHRYAQKLKQRIERAQIEAEIITALGDDVGWLVKWARSYPREAGKLVERLRRREEQQQRGNDGTRDD